MIGDHIKIVMNYLSALRMPHYKKKSHHHDRRQDKEPQKQPRRRIEDGM
jgi:hypothetical protein